MTWIQTWSGKRFNLLNPSGAMVDPMDIAVSLSRQCRFAGHTSRPYSVAEHLCVCYDVARERMRGAHDVHKLALLHDAHEAYVIDLPRPIKLALADVNSGYDAMEDRARSVVERYFGLNPDADVRANVKLIDNGVLKAEAAALMAGSKRDWTYGHALNRVHLPAYVSLGTMTDPKVAAHEWLYRLAQVLRIEDRDSGAAAILADAEPHAGGGPR